MDRGACQVAVHGVSKESDTTERLNHQGQIQQRADLLPDEGLHCPCHVH